jgi:hypothetical protein
LLGLHKNESKCRAEKRITIVHFDLFEIKIGNYVINMVRAKMEYLLVCQMVLLSNLDSDLGDANPLYLILQSTSTPSRRLQGKRHSRMLRYVTFVAWLVHEKAFAPAIVISTSKDLLKEGRGDSLAVLCTLWKVVRFMT